MREMPSYSDDEAGKIDASAPESTDKPTLEKFVLLLLGFGPGSAIACYFAAVGYYAKKVSSETLFGYQLLSVLGVQLITLILQCLLDDVYDKEYGHQQTFAFRLIFTGVVVMALCLGLPFCSTTASILCVGALLAFFATAQMSSAAQLGSLATPGGSTWVQSGNVMGLAIPVIIAPTTGFGPNASQTCAMVFFGTPALLVFVATLLFLQRHLYEMRQDSSEACDDIQRSQSFVGVAYGTLDAQQAAESSGRQNQDHAAALGSAYVLVPLFGIWLSSVSGMLPTPIFTKVGHLRSQSLLLAKLAGDAVGRALGLLHCSVYTESEAVRCAYYWSFFLLTPFRFGAVIIITWWLLDIGREDKSFMSCPAAYALLICGMAAGAYSFCIFDMYGQLKVSPGMRNAVARINMFASYVGMLSGVLLGMHLRGFEALL